MPSDTKKRKSIARRLDKIAKWYQKSGSAKILVNLIPYLGPGVDSALKTREYNQLRKYDNLESLFEEFTTEIDGQLLSPIQNLDSLQGWEIEETFESIVRDNIRKVTSMRIEDFHQELENSEINFFDIETLDPDLHVKIGRSFDKIEYTIPGSRKSILIDDPELLWDCSCAFSSAEDCVIHSNEFGDEIDKRFGQGIVLISYRDIDVVWRDSSYFWPPSVDTVYMIENLLQQDVPESFAKTICDIGCGTSLMGILLANHNENVNKLYVSDWLITPLVFSRINWEINKHDNSKVSFKPVLGYGNYWIGNKSIGKLNLDQAVSNPPYLPELGSFNSAGSQNPVGGTDLLESLIENGGEFADEIFLNFSELAKPEAKRAEEKSAASLEKIGSTHTVPFRVPAALDNEKYLDYLIGERGLEISSNSRYSYWHDISTYKLDFS